MPTTAAPAATPVAVLPHVFVFVIDSLRRDYLSPYNPAVTFTPAIDAWARDSFVFNNAFTPYGGTWLAMPSLWVGAPVTRGWGRIFGRMNALEAGITAAGYDFVINDFTVADQLRPTTSRTFLDPSIPSKDTDLCRNVEALQAHLMTRQSSAPLFTFLAPMNVHILNTGINPGTTPGYSPGFYQPYARGSSGSTGCFGALIDDLKRRGIYDSSLIVLTSDHGDALGEEGRWGHQYHLFPETIRIPLIVHLPRQSRSNRDHRPVAYQHADGHHANGPRSNRTAFRGARGFRRVPLRARGRRTAAAAQRLIPADVELRIDLWSAAEERAPALHQRSAQLARIRDRAGR